MLVRVALISLLAISCVRHLPPAPTPGKVPLSVENPKPAEPDHGRLIVDVVDGPTSVSEIIMRPEPITTSTGRTSFRFYEDDVIICETTPCAIDRPVGNIILGFPVVGKAGLRIDMVHITEEPSGYRRNLAIYRRNRHGTLYTLGIVGTSVGGGALMAGAAFLPIGLAKDSNGLTIAGAASLAAGAILTTLGIVVIRGRADVFRPGSSIHYPL